MYAVILSLCVSAAPPALRAPHAPPVVRDDPCQACTALKCNAGVCNDSKCEIGQCVTVAAEKKCLCGKACTCGCNAGAPCSCVVRTGATQEGVQVAPALSPPAYTPPAYFAAPSSGSSCGPRG